MPDWTYLPLRRVGERVVGPKRARQMAMLVVRGVARLPGGANVIRAFDHTHNHAAAVRSAAGVTYSSPVGLMVCEATAGRVTALTAMGFGFVATADSLPPGTQVCDEITINGVLAALDHGAAFVAANSAVLELGPCVAQRVNEVLAMRSQSANATESVAWFRPWSWPGWVWAFWLGVAMVCAGIGASLITGGPVLLGYDREFLRVNTGGLRSINARLVPFLQHDRITMAGCMAAIGVNDIGFSLAMRRGWRWARTGFAAAGAVGFPTFFLFFGYGFFDPLHFAVAVGFFPLFVLGLVRRSSAPTWSTPIIVNERQRRRALVGQLLMVMLAIGVVLSGMVIMSIGVRDVLIPSDRVYLRSSQTDINAALNGRLLRFIAHDRAGFGGALTSLGVGILTTCLWGWRRGERTTLWCLVISSFIGFGAALSVHFAVGYTDLLHLAPVYAGSVIVALASYLSAPWLLCLGNPLNGAPDTQTDGVRRSQRFYMTR